MPKEQVFIAKGYSPWCNNDWKWKDKIANKFVSDRVICKDITNTGWMFRNCSNLISLDLSGFDTSDVIAMDGMFDGCENLTTLDLSNFDTSKLDSMWCMFLNCENLTTLDLSSFDTSKVKNMYSMFENCYHLTELDLSNFDTSKVENMCNMFWGCENLTTIKGIIDMKSCTKDKDYERMFTNCSKLKGVKIKNPPANFENASGLSKYQYTIVS